MPESCKTMLRRKVRARRKHLATVWRQQRGMSTVCANHLKQADAQYANALVEIFNNKPSKGFDAALEGIKHEGQAEMCFEMLTRRRK